MGWWEVETQGANPHDSTVIEHVEAERVSFEGGALLLTNGDVWTREIVAAYGPTAWVSIAPIAEGKTS